LVVKTSKEQENHVTLRRLKQAVLNFRYTPINCRTPKPQNESIPVRRKSFPFRFLLRRWTLKFSNQILKF